jgi:hypothetical protein
VIAAATGCHPALVWNGAIVEAARRFLKHARRSCIEDPDSAP